MANVVLEPQSMNLEEMLQAMRESVIKELGEEGQRKQEKADLWNAIQTLDRKLRDLANTLGYIESGYVNSWEKLEKA